MKIIVVGTRGFPDVQGGVESHCEHLSGELVKLGCDMTVFTRMPYTGSGERNYKGIKLIPVSCPRNKFLEAIVHTFKCVIKAKSMQPDILHIHSVGPSLFVPVARLLGMKVVVTNHGPDYMRKKWSLPAKIFLKVCECMGVLFANEVITIADNIASDIKRKYGRESTVIPNGVKIPQKADSDIYIKKYGLEKQRYIFTLGRLVPEKGFDDLMDAFNMEGLEGWKLVIAGDADHEDNYSRNLKAKAQRYENIIMPGFLKGQPLNELFSHAGLFVIPSYYEGLPIVLLEAMSYGLSCIASGIPANRNVEMDGNRFYNVGDINALSAKILDFTRLTWNEAARDKQLHVIVEKYDWKIIAKKTLEVFNSAID